MNMHLLSEAKTRKLSNKRETANAVLLLHSELSDFEFSRRLVDALYPEQVSKTRKKLSRIDGNVEGYV